MAGDAPIKRLLQHQNRRSFDRDTGQDARVPRPSIDIDPVVTNVGMSDRGVTVHDEFPVVLRRIQEFVTNPEQIHAVLLLQGDGGADAGMDEQEIATMKTVAKNLQK